jgi:beta-glucosidase
MGTNAAYDNFYFAQPYLDALKSGSLPMSGLDEQVRRNLRVMFATRVFDPNRKIGSLNTAAHQAVARQVAEEGIVLLKNKNHILPLNEAKVKTRFACKRPVVKVPASRLFTKSPRSKAL